MFSFVGDVVLDPFLGSGTTALAAAQTGRNSLGFEIDPAYLSLAYKRVRTKAAGLFAAATTELVGEDAA
jgi:site-specific DNA-methyltransferase (adenine-specific)